LGPGHQGFDAFRMAKSEERIVIKRYAGRRLYSPGAGVYLSSRDVVDMARRGEGFVVIDAATGEDVSDAVAPIIVKH
jgi:polyhydroxyalkanoate synthesis regulator protein